MSTAKEQILWINSGKIGAMIRKNSRFLQQGLWVLADNVNFQEGENNISLIRES